MKRFYRVLIFILVLLISHNITVSGLRSKHRSLDLYISNFNQEIDSYEVKILVNKYECSVDVNENSLTEYIDSDLCELEITRVKTSIKNGRHLHQFTGDIPQSFKIEITTESESFTSQVVTEEAYNGIVYYDVLNDKITSHEVFINIFTLAACFLIFAIAAKLMIFYLCKFTLIGSMKPFLLVNLLGVSLISIILSMSNYLNGYIYSLRSLIILTILLLFIEFIVFLFTYQRQKLKVKIIYSIIANVVLFLLGGLLTLITIF